MKWNFPPFYKTQKLRSMFHRFIFIIITIIIIIIIIII